MAARILRLASRWPERAGDVGAEHVEQADQRQRIARHLRRQALVAQVAGHVHADEHHLEAADEVACHQQPEARVAEGLRHRLQRCSARASRRPVLWAGSRRPMASGAMIRDSCRQHQQGVLPAQLRDQLALHRHHQELAEGAGRGRHAHRPGAPFRLRSDARSRRRSRHRWFRPGRRRSARRWSARTSTAWSKAPCRPAPGRRTPPPATSTWTAPSLSASMPAKTPITPHERFCIASAKEKVWRDQSCACVIGCSHRPKPWRMPIDRVTISAPHSSTCCRLRGWECMRGNVAKRARARCRRGGAIVDEFGVL